MRAHNRDRFFFKKRMRKFWKNDTPDGCDYGLKTEPLKRVLPF